MRLKILIILILLFCSGAVDAAGEWEEYKCRHFLIYYHDSPIDFVKTVEEMAEKYYDEITDNLGFRRMKSWNWDERAKIYIYDSANDYKHSARTLGWSSGMASTLQKIIRTYPTAHGFFDSTLPHELGHIIFREFIGHEADVPRWLEEGVAMYQEKAKRWGAHDAVRQAMKEEIFIPLDELSRMRITNRTDRKTVSLFYAEAASIVYYMISELGEHKFVRFCRKIEDEKDFEKALSSVYYRFDNVEDLNESWVRYLKD